MSLIGSVSDVRKAIAPEETLGVEAFRALIQSLSVQQSQTSKEKKIFALLHPSSGMGRPVGHSVGSPVSHPAGSIEHQMQAGKIGSIKQLGQEERGFNQTFYGVVTAMTHAPIDVYIKPVENELGYDDTLAVHNQSATYVARVMGNVSVPPMVIRDVRMRGKPGEKGTTEKSIVTAAIANAQSAEAFGFSAYNKSLIRVLKSDMSHIALFDAVISMPDRHGGNWLIQSVPRTTMTADKPATPGGYKAWAIDHDIAFGDHDNPAITHRFDVGLLSMQFQGEALTQTHKAALDSLVQNKEEVSAQLLQLGLRDHQIKEMYDRISHMQKFGTFPFSGEKVQP